MMTLIKRIFKSAEKTTQAENAAYSHAPALVGPQPASTLSVDPMTMLGKLAKPGCGKCYGRGYTATMHDGRPVPCRCALNNGRLVLQQAAAIRAAQKKD